MAVDSIVPHIAMTLRLEMLVVPGHLLASGLELFASAFLGLAMASQAFPASSFRHCSQGHDRFVPSSRLTGASFDIIQSWMLGGVFPRVPCIPVSELTGD